MKHLLLGLFICIGTWSTCAQNTPANIAKDQATNSAFKNSVAVYPIPAKERLHITLPSKEATTISLYNIVGQEMYVATSKERKHTIDVGSFPSGVYLVRVAKGKAILAQKVIID